MQSGTQKKVGYLGPEGSYCEIAAQAMCSGAQLVPYANFYLIVNSLINGETDAAVLPIENTINGAVRQNIDLLQAHSGLSAVCQYTVKIDHRLFTLAGADRSGITRIYSHKQALDQCSEFISKNYPYAVTVATDSTSGALAMVNSPSYAAIAGVQCERSGLDMSPECISDEKNNYTHFLKVVRGGIPEDFRSERVFVSLTCPNVPGGLLKLLQIIYGFGLNMSEIESRPIKDKPGEYRFFVELEADYSSRKVKDALAELKKSTNSFRVLGCY
ncbi:MAG: ACT domain-containing protein [Clostridia bacterium]|nr:ACT domain-containing protein [Clostridia bacterium]